jgi:DNA-binding transcriptional regulator PaaX
VTWLLLIYTVPSQPSRKRAAVWRELKKAGAVYLRDGVAVLPERPETHAIFRAIATKVEEFGGQATLVTAARLDSVRAAAVVVQAQASRTEEYAEIAREAELLLAHTERERTHRELSFTELEEIKEDLGKLRRWADQVRARDHFDAEALVAVDDLLKRGDQEVALLKEEVRV